MKDIFTLTRNERRLITAALLRPDSSAKDIAARAEITERSVRHSLHSLMSRGVLTPLYKIDIYRLGFTDFRIYLGEMREPTRVLRAFEKSVLQYPQVYWVAKTTGAYQYAITFLAQKPTEMIDFFPAIRPPHEGFYAARSVSIAGEWTVFAPTYLCPEYTERDSINLSSREQAAAIDDIDRRILVAMAKNPAASTAELARILGMKASSFSYRLERLSAAGIYRGRIFLLQPRLFGVSVYRLTIVERGLSNEQRQRFKEYVSRHPNVCAFLECTGAWDYEIRFEAESAAELDNFCQALIDTFGSAIGSLTICEQATILKRVSYPCR